MEHSNLVSCRKVDVVSQSQEWLDIIGRMESGRIGGTCLSPAVTARQKSQCQPGACLALTFDASDAKRCYRGTTETNVCGLVASTRWDPI
jgi:hypothetical protein